MINDKNNKTFGIYSKVVYTDADNQRIADYIKKHNFPNPVATNDIHTTLVYSRKPFQWKPNLGNSDNTPIATASTYQLEVFESDTGNYLVALVHSEYLVKRWVEAIDNGATWDYPEYRPHITLATDIGDFDISDIPDPVFDLQIVKEVVEQLKD